MAAWLPGSLAAWLLPDCLPAYCLSWPVPPFLPDCSTSLSTTWPSPCALKPGASFSIPPSFCAKPPRTSSTTCHSWHAAPCFTTWRPAGATQRAAELAVSVHHAAWREHASRQHIQLWAARPPMEQLSHHGPAACRVMLLGEGVWRRRCLPPRGPRACMNFAAVVGALVGWLGQH